jgi:hypothetical protein
MNVAKQTTQHSAVLLTLIWEYGSFITLVKLYVTNICGLQEEPTFQMGSGKIITPTSNWHSQTMPTEQITAMQQKSSGF